MQITPELIDHTEFHTGLWLQNAANPGWYYFSKRKNPNIISRHSFIESVDKPLKDVVNFLHKNGIRTTPSCSGHLFPGHKIEKLYRSISVEADLIKSRGIYLKDVQTDKLFLFRNKNYELPWSKTDFINSLMQYQTKGILGIRLHRKLNAENILRETPDKVESYLRDNILFFLCENANNEKCWKEITALVKKNVKS